jgi:hypothetical protein
LFGLASKLVDSLINHFAHFNESIVLFCDEATGEVPISEDIGASKAFDLLMVA